VYLAPLQSFETGKKYDQRSLVQIEALVQQEGRVLVEGQAARA
jgi:hypothetical protein